MATYQSQVLDHLGLVAGMFNELGIREVIDRTIPQDMPKYKLPIKGGWNYAALASGLSHLAITLATDLVDH